MIEIDEVIKLIDRLSFQYMVYTPYPVTGSTGTSAYQHKEIPLVYAELLKSELEKMEKRKP